MSCNCANCNCNIQLCKYKCENTGYYIYDQNETFIKKEYDCDIESTDPEINHTSNIEYCPMCNVNIEFLGRGFIWMDAGTHLSMLNAGNIVQSIESRQNIKIACLEEIAFRHGWIDEKELETLAVKLKNTDYGRHIKSILDY